MVVHRHQPLLAASRRRLPISYSLPHLPKIPPIRRSCGRVARDHGVQTKPLQCRQSATFGLRPVNFSRRGSVPSRFRRLIQTVFIPGRSRYRAVLRFRGLYTPPALAQRQMAQPSGARANRAPESTMCRGFPQTRSPQELSTPRSLHLTTRLGLVTSSSQATLVQLGSIWMVAV